MGFTLGAMVDIRRAQQELAANLLRAGGKVLLVGHRTAKHWGRWDGHPRVEILTEDNARSPSISANVRVVLAARFMSHGTFEVVKDLAARRGIHMIRVERDGEVDDLLREALAPQPKPDSAPERQEQEQEKEKRISIMSSINEIAANVAANARQADKKPTPPGAIRTLIELEGGNLSDARSAIVDRVWPTAQERYPSTTRDSIGQCVYMMKRERGIEEVGRPGGARLRKPASVAPARVVETTPTAAPLVKAGDDDVARLLINAIESMQLALASYREELAKGEERVKAKVRLMLEELT